MKVSICMITYNHERFISQAIESVLMQKTNFDYELVIGEDCSTDSTREILTEYQKKYPEKIKLFLNAKNEGANKNFIRIFSNCNGEYISLLEGDDFWSSPDKLQKQVEFMDSHRDCSMSFHKAALFYEESPQKMDSVIPSEQFKPFSTVEDLLETNFIPCLSVMYRRDSIPSIPEELTKFWMLDWPLHILVAGSGKIGFINETMAKYRRHENSITSKTGIIPSYCGKIEMLTAINEYQNFKYDHIVKATISKMYYSLSFACLDQKSTKDAKKYLKKSLRVKFFNSQVPKTGLLWLFFRIYFLGFRTT